MDIYFPHASLVDSLSKLGTATTGSEEIPSAKRRVMRHTFTQGFLVTSAVPSLAAQSMLTAGSRQGNGWQRWKIPTSFSFHAGGLDPEDDISALIDTETKDGNNDEVGVQRGRHKRNGSKPTKMSRMTKRLSTKHNLVHNNDAR